MSVNRKEQSLLFSGPAAYSSLLVAPVTIICSRCLARDSLPCCLALSLLAVGGLKMRAFQEGGLLCLYERGNLTAGVGLARDGAASLPWLIGGGAQSFV